MSVAESERRASVQRRWIPLAARFSPQILAELCGAVRNSGGGTRRRGMAGLLFGKAERNVVSLEAFLGVTAECADDARSSDGEALERVLDQMLGKCKLRPELAGLELAGWCCVQPTDELSDTPRGWLEFHTRRFRRVSDVLLILRGDAIRELAGRVYARASDLPISLDHYAYGEIAIDAERPASRAVTVSIAAQTESLHPELYFRTYESARALEKAEKRQARREALRRMIDWRLPRPAPVTITDPTPAAPPAKQTAPQMAVVRAAPLEFGAPTRGGKRTWILPAALLFLAAGLAVAWFKPQPAHSARTEASSPAPQSGGLGLRVDVQGDALLVSWDRDAPAVQAAATGILRIQDGQERRNTELTAAELASGSILYRPRSDDVDFLLTVFSAGGLVTREGMRAVDGASGARTDAAPPEPQPVTAAMRLRSTEVRSTPGKAAGKEIGRPSSAAQDYTAPKPLRVVMPDVAHLDAAQLPAAGKIMVEVEIDEQGRVTGAKIPAGAPRVSGEAARAAIAAAEQWRFEPAKLGGKNVPSRHRLIFDIRAGPP